jgi:hypothetical protein
MPDCPTLEHTPRRCPTALACHALAAALALAALPAGAATVTLTGELTSFQSALEQIVDPLTGVVNPAKTGDGTLNGVPLVLDLAAPAVRYPTAFNQFYPQSKTVALPAGTTQAQFEYTSFIGTANASPNRISFAAGPAADMRLGDTFKIGTVSFTNGFWFPAATIGLAVTTHSADPALDNKTFLGQIQVVVTNNDIRVTDPDLNADYFYLNDAGGQPLNALGSVRVYEAALQPASHPGNTGSADLYARIGSLIPMRFDNPSGGAFLQASFTPTPSVPEPAGSTLWLAGAAAGLAWHRRRQMQPR